MHPTLSLVLLLCRHVAGGYGGRLASRAAWALRWAARCAGLRVHALRHVRARGGRAAAHPRTALLDGGACAGCRGQLCHVDRRARALPDTRKPRPSRPARRARAARAAPPAPPRPAARRLVAPRHSSAPQPCPQLCPQLRASSSAPARARCGGWEPRSLPSSRCSAPCPPVRGSTTSSPRGAERPGSALPLVSQPPSPPACAPKHSSPPGVHSSQPKHTSPTLDAALQPPLTVCRPLRDPHRRPETAGVALQGAPPGGGGPGSWSTGIRRRPSAERRRRASSSMYGGAEHS